MPTPDDMTTARTVDTTAHDLVHHMGQVFAVFDERRQDSGHVSYGVDTGSGRYFVKTAGGPQPSVAGTSRDERVRVLRRAAQVHEIEHPALVELHEVITTSDGVAVVYNWFDGELLGCPRERRQEPAEAHNRFKALPRQTIIDALDQVIDLHVALESAGWVSGDFYDGCLMYDFHSDDIRVIDFECYQQGSYLNDRGRMPGSTRFMAPEEFELGATIDSRTSVFNLARMIESFFLARHESAAQRALVAAATAALPDDRPQRVADLQRQWRAAYSPSGSKYESVSGEYAR